MNHATAPASREGAAVTAAGAARARCICEEDPDNGLCAHTVPISREQVGRLRAYAAQHPERAFIMSELTGEWMTALTNLLPEGADGEDRVLAWMRAPYALPPAAGMGAQTLGRQVQ